MLAGDYLNSEPLAADLPAKARKRHPSPRKSDLERLRKTQRLVRVDLLPLIHRQCSERAGRLFGGKPPNGCSHPAFVFAPAASLLNLAQALQLTDAGADTQNRQVQILCNFVGGRAAGILRE